MKSEDDEASSGLCFNESARGDGLYCGVGERGSTALTALSEDFFIIVVVIPLVGFNMTTRTGKEDDSNVDNIIIII